MKKAVFFDIDGTLWNDRCEILPSTAEAVRKVRENGHLAFICSGRSRSCIRNQSLLEIGFDGIIASCGTHIDFHKETVFEELLSKETVEHVLAVTKKHRLPIVLEGPKYIYVNPEDFTDDPFVVFLRKELGEDVRMIPENCGEIYINKFSASTKNVDLEALKEDLGEAFDLIVHAEDKVFEAVPAGYSKATGIKKVCELFDIAPEYTYAFGDSENDHEMLEFVAYGIAMGNAAEETKRIADYITSAVDADGIANGLKHFGLI